MAQRFSGKVVVITGASTGIGAAAARKFADEGATVALIARSADVLEKVAADIRGSGGTAHAFPADVSDPRACAEVLGLVAEAFGGIDVLVNNAGKNTRGPVEQVDPGELRQIIEVNLIAPIVLCRFVLPYLRERGRGAIVNVASIAGQTPLPGEAAYSASKFGLRGFTFALREELAGTSITVGAVSPGPVDTGFIMDELDEVPNMVFATPMSTAEEVARQVLDSAADGAQERTIPVMTGYMAKASNLFPQLRDMLRPILDKRGGVIKEQYRARQRRDAK
jgi:short-subunit dehydrogenase